MWNTSIELDNRVKWERHSNCWWNREWMITPDSQTAANGWRRRCNVRLCNWLSMMQYHGCVECRSQTAFITSQLHTHSHSPSVIVHQSIRINRPASSRRRRNHMPQPVSSTSGGRPLHAWPVTSIMCIVFYSNQGPKMHRLWARAWDRRTDELQHCLMPLCGRWYSKLTVSEQTTEW